MKKWRKIISVSVILSMMASMFIGLTTVRAETETQGADSIAVPVVDVITLEGYPKIYSSTTSVVASHNKWMDLCAGIPSDYAAELTMNFNESPLRNTGFSAIKIGNDILKFHPYQSEVKYQEQSETFNWTTGTKYIDYDFGNVSNDDGTVSQTNSFKVYIERKSDTIRFAIKGENDENYYYGASIPVTADAPETVSVMQIYAFNCDTTITSLDIYSLDGKRGPVSYELADYEAESSDEMVVTPHFGTPAFVEPGSTFEVELTSKEYKNLSKDGWIISLENDYSIWFCEVTEATDYTENGVYLGMKDGYKLIVKVPENVPCELLNLSVRHRDSLKERRAPQSVSVIENIDENFYAVGISDTHLTKWNSATTAIQEGSNLELFNKQMQLAGARYLYHGGDMTTVTGSTDRKQETMDLMVDAFTDTKVPLIAVAGNHEYDCASTNYTGDEFTFDEFDRIFGRRSALIEMGNNMIIAKHDIGGFACHTGEPDAEIKTEPFILRDALTEEWQAWNEGNKDVGYRVLYQHTWNTGNEKGDYLGNKERIQAKAAFMSPTYHIVENAVPYDFQAVGHNHAVYTANENTLVFGGSGKDDCNWSGECVIFNYTYDDSTDKKWSMDIDNLVAEDAEKAATVTHKWPGGEDDNALDNDTCDYFIDRYQSDFVVNGVIEEGVLYDDFLYPNDGTTTINNVKITNNMDFNFYNGRIQFVMKKGAYSVSGGEIVSQYDSYDGTKTVIDVKVNIPSSGEVSISAYPIEGIENEKVVFIGTETGYVSYGTEYIDLFDANGVGTNSVTVNNSAEFTASVVNNNIMRISFTKPLEAGKEYTVEYKEITAKFIVLPQKFIQHPHYGDTPIYTTAVDESIRKICLPQAAAKNYVTEFTVKTSGIPGRTKDVVRNYNDHFWIDVLPEGKTDESDMIARIYKQNWSGSDVHNWVYYVKPDSAATMTDQASVTANPLTRLELEGTYDFRIIKIGENMSVYAKKTSDTSYDHLFTVNGMPETATYIRTSVQTGDTSTAYQNLRVYSLDPEYVTVEKNEQGQLVVSGSFFGNASGKTYMVILAEYTEDESRIKNILVYRDEQSILEGDNTFSFTSEEISEGTHIVRPFVWTEDMEPICKAEKAKLSK